MAWSFTTDERLSSTKFVAEKQLHNVKRPQHGPKNRWIDTIELDLVSLMTALLGETFCDVEAHSGYGGIPGSRCVCVCVCGVFSMLISM